MLKTQNETLINDMGTKKCHRPGRKWQNTNVYCDCNHEDAFVNRENEKNEKKVGDQE